MLAALRDMLVALRLLIVFRQSAETVEVAKALRRVVVLLVEVEVVVHTARLLGAFPEEQPGQGHTLEERAEYT